MTKGERRLDLSNVKLCGRNHEQTQLLRAFERVVAVEEQEKCCVTVMVEGVSGCGKSALVEAFGEEIRHTYAGQCFFCRGKFDPGQAMAASEPFSAVVGCFNDLAWHMLHDDLFDWKSTIRERIPRQELRALESILPSVWNAFGLDHADNDEDCTERTETGVSVSFRSDHSTGSPDTNQEWGFHCFRMAARAVLRVVTSQVPVVFAMDDLQWADEASVDLIETLVTDHAVRSNFMFLYTHRLVDIESPLKNLMTKAMSSSGGHHHHIVMLSLSNLEMEHVHELLTELLGRKDVSNLAESMYEWTQGNPLFFVHLMDVLQTESIVYYNEFTRSWDWDIRRVRQYSSSNLAESIVHVLLEKLKSMPSLVLAALSQAACVGSSVIDIHILHNILGEDVGTLRELQVAMDKAVTEGLIHCLEVEGTYRFSHDSVQEAALALLPTGESRTRLHWKIGMHLSGMVHEDKPSLWGADSVDHSICPSSDDRIVLLSVHHLNRGAECLLETVEDRVKLAGFNAKAADVAFAKSAFFPAADYLQAALGLLNQSPRKWEDHHDLTLKVTSNLAHVLRCCGRLEEADVAVADVLTNANNMDGTVQAYRTRIVSLSHSGRYDEALDVNLDVLEKLGVQIPRKYILWHIFGRIRSLKRWLRGMKDEDLVPHHPHPSAHVWRVTRLLSLYSLTAVLCGRKVHYLNSVVQIAWLMMKCGGRDESRAGIRCCAIIFMLLKEYDAAHRFASLALQIAKEGGEPVQDARTIGTMHMYIVHWKQPYQESLDSLLKLQSMVLGDEGIDVLMLSIFAYSLFAYLCGLDLRSLLEDATKSLELMHDYGQNFNAAMLRPFVDYVRVLAGNDSWASTGAQMTPPQDIGALEKELLETQNDVGLQILFLCEMMRAYFFDDMTVAEEMSRHSACKVVPYAWLPLSLFFQGLIAFRLSNSRDMNGRTRRWSHKRRGQSILQLLETFRARGNVNCHHMVLLLRAEEGWFHCNSGPDEVQQAYDDAIVAAGELGFLHHCALGNELAAEYCLAKGDQFWACTYMIRAWESYQRWGAIAKADQVKSKYNDIVEKSEHALPRGI